MSDATGITPEGAFQVLKDNTVEAINAYFPFEGKNKKLIVEQVHIDDKLATDDIASQTAVKDKDGTWGVPIKANLKLINKHTGEVLDEKKGAILGRLPKLTNRYSYIVNGNEYQVDHLFRLRSGVYTRVQNNGELETEFNLAKSPTGRNFSLHLDPATKKMSMQYGDAKIALYPLMKTLGVADDDLEKSWGPQVLAANKPATEKKTWSALASFYKRTGGGDPTNLKSEDLAQHVHAFFEGTKLRPDTTLLTLGQAHDKVSGKTLFQAAHKLLGVSRGTHQPDDRDSLAFKEVASIEDFIPERLARTKAIRARLRQGLDSKTAVGEILPADIFNRPIHEFFTKGSSVTERSDQTNPIQMLSAHRKTTLMAKDFGGIKSDKSLTMEMRAVNESHLGFLDPMHTPECSPGDTEVYTKRGWVRWDAVHDSDEFLCQPDGPTKYAEGRTAFHKAERLVTEPYTGLMYGMDNGKIGYLVTPNHRVLCRPYAKPGESALRVETADLVHGKPRMFPVAHRPTEFPSYPSAFKLPKVEDYASNVDEVPMEDWSEFMGWYLSEGSCSNGSAIISQCRAANEEKYERIQGLLRRLPFGKWCEPTAAKDFRKYHKQLSAYLTQFGYCQDKFIPEYIFTASIPARERFIEAMLLGDGRTFSSRKPGSKVKSYEQKVFCTTSRRLASGFENLATEMGYSVRTLVYSDSREERYLDTYEVRLLKHKERVALPYSHLNHKRGKTEFVRHYYTQEFDGLVYSATVPGGLLFLRRPGRLGVWSGNSEKAGISLHLAANVRKNGKDLEIPVYDLQDKKFTWVNATTFHTSTAVLPDQVSWKDGKPVPVSGKVKMKMSGGGIAEGDPKQARYVLHSAKGMFNYASNLVPFLPCDNGTRVMMADKQMEQALGLKHREIPLVQTKTDHPTDPTHTFERFLGHFVANRSPVSGRVVSVKDTAIRIRTADGKHHDVHLYKDFPLNDAKGMLHSEPIVKPGDSITKGQVVADNNYTKGGDLAIGTNLNVGYLPYKGYNFEDGIVISESAATKLTSEHLHKKLLDFDSERDEISMSKFNAFATTRKLQMRSEHRAMLDADGIIKPGSKVEAGQVMVAAVSKNDPRKMSFLSGYNKKRAFQPYRDKSMIWDEDHIGTVTKVIRDPSGGVKVYVRTDEPAMVGDKLTGRHGNKGIITQILKDEHMPFTKDSEGQRKHLEVLLNPTGVPTRINPGQMLETAAGKVAQKTGKPYIVNNFAGPHHDYRTEVVEALKKHGLTDEEMVYDPADVRKPLGSVMVGPQYILKLKHQVEKKLQARGGLTDVSGAKLPIDNDRQPSKGGDRGGQAFGALELYALLGHDARHNIREMSTYKSDQQDALFWSMIQTGHEPPPPKAPFAYNKFVGLLQGLGVHVEKVGSEIRIHPMNNKEVLRLADNGRNEIKTPKALISKNLEPYKGGLFDKDITGGVDGDKWSFMRLSEPMPNPIFVGQNNRPGPIPTLLGMKIKQFESLMAGTTTIGGLTGGHAVEAALKKVDVEKEITQLRTELPHLRTDELDRANRKLKYLLALKVNNLKPHEAYIMHYVPVVPPKFRPASPTPDGSVAYSPLNGHYKNIGLLNEKLTNFDSTVFSAEHKQPLRAQLWDALKGLQSVGNYKPVYDVDSSGNRDLAGILDLVSKGGTEGQPKTGYFQAKVLKKRQNLSMRATIIPEPALHLDEVGLPRGAAMEMYKPYVVAQLVKWGQPPLKAQEAIKSNSEVAQRALQAVVDDRPVIMKRDPVLHKFGVMAFRPKLIDGKAIQIHPLVTGGYNADFDGDAMAVSVPMSREAVNEAKKLFPSNNLFSPTNYGAMYTPGHESLLGLHLLTTWGKPVSKKFGSVKELDDAVAKGSITVSDVVHVTGFKKPTTYGRILVESRMPTGSQYGQAILHDPSFVIAKKTLRDVAGTLAKKDPKAYPGTIDGLKNLGNEWSFKLGFSFGLKDLATIPERDKVMSDHQKKADHITKTIHDKTARDAALVLNWNAASDELDEAQKRGVGRGNRLATMVMSGARGDESQLRQMTSAPGLMEDSTGKTLTHPIKRSFSEGLDIGDYWISQHGARKGILQKNRGTAEPGAITKDIINASMSTLIVSPDCKTTQGISLKLTDPDIHDRYTAISYALKGGGKIHAGSLITPEVLDKLKHSKHERISVRSPLKCAHGEGLCSKCFGLNESGVHHPEGTNIGILASQAMGEPSTQLSMRAFHTGGVAGTHEGKTIDAITRLRNLLEMPGTLKDEATVAREGGKITSITKDPVGGLDVHVNGVRHYIPHRLIPKSIQTLQGEKPLAVGTEVKKGDQLSGGFLNPHHLLAATKDIHAVQNFLTNGLHDGLYKGLGVRRRNIEVAVRSITNLAKVRDPGHSDWDHGDVVQRTVLEEHNRNLPKGHLPVAYDAILKGTGEIPHLITKDWIQRLNYQELHTTVQQAASQGQKSNVHSSSPIPGIAFGSEFGKPPPGTPKYHY